MNKKIILTGGGTAGHVTPNIALIPLLKKDGYDITYIGSFNGIEKELIQPLGVKYYGISSGKLRRYLDFKNVTDAFRVVKGLSDAVKIIRDVKPNIIFSKGGFVSVPVALGGYLTKTPVIIHESDISVGLANKIAIPFANKVCATFPEALNNIKENKAVLTGTPIRQELFKGSKDKGIEICNFSKNTINSKKYMLIMGGSLGSVKINNALRENLDKLLEKFNIMHLCGKGNLDESLNNKTGYCQMEYASKELPHILALSDIIISRAGSNSICEFLALKKPNLLIPLSKEASRGDQILNANSFKKQGFSEVLFEEDLTNETLLESIDTLLQKEDMYIKNMSNTPLSSATEKVMIEINKY